MGKLAGILAAMTMMGPEINGNSIPLSKEARAIRDAENLEKYYQRNGLQKFEVDGKTVWARDEKNAIRKAKNGQ